jgi:hypothetical protein
MMTMSIPSGFDGLARFQLRVAKDWIREAEHVQSRPAFQFMAYFAALNALYWLWGVIDGGGIRVEQKLLENLVQQLGEIICGSILKSVEPQWRWFASRGPIQRMDKRKGDTPGDERPGRAALETLLRRELANVERTKALATVVYLVRCNLVHGSKVIGVDFELLAQGAPIAQAFAGHSVEYTAAALRQGE